MIFSLSSIAQKGINFNLYGIIYDESTSKPIESVKIDLIKDNIVVQSVITLSNGKYKLSLEINQSDSNAANYTVNFSHEKMISKFAKINTYIRKPLANAYDFKLEVFMTERKEDDLIIDLPSAKIKWDEKGGKFNMDQKYANIIKQIKQQGDPKLIQKLVEKQKKEEDVQRKKEEEKRARTESEKQATEEMIKKNLEALRKQQEEFGRLAALQKAKEDSVNQVAEDALKKGMNIIKKQVEEIEKKEAKMPSSLKKNQPVYESVVKEKDEEMSIKEIYGIHNMNSLRSQRYTISKKLERRKAKNLSNKYESINPLTNLLDEIDKYEKSINKSTNN